MVCYFSGIDISNSSLVVGAIFGTHVAGTISSKTYGLAKKTTLVDVRVLNAAGKGSFHLFLLVYTKPVGIQ